MAIGSGESYDDLEYQNGRREPALYDWLEKEVVPLFYNRGGDHISARVDRQDEGRHRQLEPMYNTTAWSGNTWRTSTTRPPRGG